MAFLLDTNVISETVRPRPDKTVIDWIESQIPSDLFLAGQTLGELVRGARRVKEQARREQFERWIQQDLARQFDGRILPFDAPTAAVWGRLMGDGDRAGRRPSAADAQIAAAAIQHDLTLVTRNVKDFRNFDIRLLDPWQDFEDAQ
ncbi:MAG: type II toxin-antitoxin system VapC family toxin [Alphaproteobacteria bacterium]|nr:type II toxin-antitoxin system VapC family toxin [Alphaproteobacteria bacterium]